MPEIAQNQTVKLGNQFNKRKDSDESSGMRSGMVKRSPPLHPLISPKSTKPVTQ